MTDEIKVAETDTPTALVEIPATSGAIGASEVPTIEETPAAPVIGPEVAEVTASVGEDTSAPQTRGIRVVIDDIEKWSNDVINVVEQSKGIQTLARDYHATILALEEEYHVAAKFFLDSIAAAKAEIEKVL